MLAKTYVMASALHGVLVDEAGTPAAGVRVTRRWTWGWNSRTDSSDVITDAEGRFSFPEVAVSPGLTGRLPHAPGIGIEVSAEIAGAELILLDLKKRNYDRDGELDGKPFKIRCRTDIEPDARGFFWGTCELDDS
ncbi:DUF6795 domain-containing protein [Meridianimarinicoccus aquatilis]|uniref:Carboxypeptidase regulatory-like domain-containing protein n=1 Tax=Meridianimarinicoccus aquatilis TaxID=2552766 RepID=A0A4V3BB79_9RHOB|nr:carboxypeptidase-like regulatory domain-containing protein [Fluviibacterium aquatile]QIE40510.1 carboxypeptidase regulatory-like domain-containing protein [Rhodobacteraceae bacterium SC52]TDL86079.1 carboxypeptidase regulatory-like domain-containing protein [Fluviibacterium aquatile]